MLLARSLYGSRRSLVTSLCHRFRPVLCPALQQDSIQFPVHGCCCLLLDAATVTVEQAGLVEQCLQFLQSSTNPFILVCPLSCPSVNASLVATTSYHLTLNLARQLHSNMHSSILHHSSKMC